MNADNDSSLATAAIFDRIASRTASTADWESLASRALTDRHVWRRVSEVLVVDAAVHRISAEAEDCAARVDLPACQLVGGPLRISRSSGALAQRFVPWTGWIAAAVILFAAIVTLNRSTVPETTHRSPPSLSGVVVHSADDALAEYMLLGAQEGRIVTQLPLVTVETRAVSDDAKVEVVYVRQIVERTLIDQDHVYRMASDEHGRPVPVPAGEITNGRRGRL